MESIVGKILYDRYRIVQELGSRLSQPWLIGSSLGTTETNKTFVQDDFGQVYLAEDLSQHSQVKCIIERLQPSYDNEVLGSGSWQKVLQAFVTQGENLQNISQHPQIPQLWDFFECDREFYLVNEYIKGKSLREKLDSTLIDEAEAIAWLREIMGILEFSHKLGIAHLNIQPSSLIQHQDGRKFLTNFVVFRSPILLSSPGSQDSLAKQLAKPDFVVDIHALGKTIIFALTGEFASSIQAKYSELGESQKVEILENSDSADIRPELANILNKMVGKYPDQCYQCVGEVLTDLDFEHNVITFPPPFRNSSRLSSPQSKKNKNIKRHVKQKNNNQLKTGRLKHSPKMGWLLLALPFAIAAVIIFMGINKNSNQKFTDYVNSDYQFALQYPQNWSQRQLDDPITGGVVVFNSPLETDTDLFREKVYIAVEYLESESTSLEQYTQTVFERIYQTKGSKVEVYEDYKTTIDKFPARRVIYSRQEEGLLLRQMETFTIKNNQVYIAIYTAERAKFSKFHKTAEKIINSWKIE